jgi:hypothetical protein
MSSNFGGCMKQESDKKLGNITIKVTPKLRERAEAIWRTSYQTIPFNSFLGFLVESGVKEEELVSLYRKKRESDREKEIKGISAGEYTGMLATPGYRLPTTPIDNMIPEEGKMILEMIRRMPTEKLTKAFKEIKSIFDDEMLNDEDAEDKTVKRA